MRSRKISVGLLLSAFLLAGFACYWRAIHSEFIFDDTLRIAAAVIRDGRIVFEPQLALQQGLGYVLGSDLADRPLLMLTIWLNYAFGGMDPSGYKFVNILLHIFNGCLLYFFLLRTSRFFALPESPLFAALVALLFIVHPLHSQAVTMVIQRGAILSTAFGLLSLFCAFDFLEGKNWNFSLLAGLCFLCALLCKPNALTVPFVALLFSFYARKTENIKDLLVPFLLAGAFPVVFYLGYRDNFHEKSQNPASWITYGLVQSKVIFHYLRQVVWPGALNVSYAIEPTATFGEVWMFCLAHFGIIGLAVFGAAKRIFPAVALLAFYITLIPESSFFPIPHVVFDHRMYLPSIFLSLALYAGSAKIPAGYGRKAMGSGFLLACLALALVTDARNEETKTYVDWLASSSWKSPGDNLAGVNALSVLWSTRPHGEGLKLAERLLAAHPDSPEYELLAKLFALETGGARRGAVLNVLLSPDYDFLTSITRLNLIQWEIAEFRKIPDEDIAREEMHHLLAAQRKFFRQPDFTSIESFYRLNLSSLHGSYLKLAASGLLTPYQRTVWFTFLGEFPDQVKYLPDWDRFLFSRSRPQMGGGKPVFAEKPGKAV